MSGVVLLLLLPVVVCDFWFISMTPSCQSYGQGQTVTLSFSGNGGDGINLQLRSNSISMASTWTNPLDGSLGSVTVKLPSIFDSSQGWVFTLTTDCSFWCPSVTSPHFQIGPDSGSDCAGAPTPSPPPPPTTSTTVAASNSPSSAAPPTSFPTSPPDLSWLLYVVPIMALAALAIAFFLWRKYCLGKKQGYARV
jgi:hypothetical protein